MPDRKLTISSPAKINLYLGVRPEVVDGYHQLDTVFHTIALHDTLTVEVQSSDKPLDPAERLVLSCDPPLDVPTPSNLVYRALVLFTAAAGPGPLRKDQRLLIHLDKKIPLQAGLGGGSSNGAAALLAFCRLWDIDPLSPLCTEVAARLGADVSFFLHGGCAHMSGKGDRFEQAFETLDAPVVLVKEPDLGVSTSAAYHIYDKSPIIATGVEGICDALTGSGGDRLHRVVDLLENNLEPAARLVQPGLTDSLEWLAVQDGVIGSMLCGSGSAAFALVGSDEQAEAIARAARLQNLWADATHLSPQGVFVEEDLLC